MITVVRLNYKKSFHYITNILMIVLNEVFCKPLVKKSLISNVENADERILII